MISSTAIRYFISQRIRTLKEIRAKIRPEPAREPLPPLPRRYAPPRASAAQRNRAISVGLARRCPGRRSTPNSILATAADSRVRDGLVSGPLQRRIKVLVAPNPADRGSRDRTMGGRPLAGITGAALRQPHHNAPDYIKLHNDIQGYITTNSSRTRRNCVDSQSTERESSPVSASRTDQITRTGRTRC